MVFVRRNLTNYFNMLLTVFPVVEKQSYLKNRFSGRNWIGGKSPRMRFQSSIWHKECLRTSHNTNGKNTGTGDYMHTVVKQSDRREL